MATKRSWSIHLHPKGGSHFDFTYFEEEARRKGHCFPAGVDEAGRGPLAGPVVACACVLPPNYKLPGLKESKQLSCVRRKAFFEALTKDPSVSYGVGIISHEVIDAINILEATKQAMCAAILKVCKKPDFLLIDAVELKDQPIPYLSLVKGDCRSQAIAAASVIAKETRDLLMEEYDAKWPQYGFSKHKGYGTRMHREALEKYGPCPIHRLTFKPCSSYT